MNQTKKKWTNALYFFAWMLLFFFFHRFIEVEKDATKTLFGC